MEQPGFAFDLPLIDVASVSAGGTRIAPPHQGKATGAALHCSVMGAQHGRTVQVAQQQRLLQAYRRCGPLTDAEMEIATGIAWRSICARRNELVKLGLVEKDDGRVRKNPTTGINNTLWRLKED